MFRQCSIPSPRLPFPLTHVPFLSKRYLDVPCLKPVVVVELTPVAAQQSVHPKSYAIGKGVYSIPAVSPDLLQVNLFSHVYSIVLNQSFLMNYDSG